MDAVWRLTIPSRFATIPANPGEGDYNAPYNKLLHFPFSVDGPFVVVPQKHPIAKSRQSIDFMEYQVFWGDAPIFILEIRTGPKLGLLSAREDADLQIRRRLTDLVGICPLPKLHAVSAMGTKLCFYTAYNHAITPPRIVGDDQLTVDTAPRERWDCDVVEAEGAARLKAVVHEMQHACDQLDPSEHLNSFEMSLTEHVTKE